MVRLLVSEGCGQLLLQGGAPRSSLTRAEVADFLRDRTDRVRVCVHVHGMMRFKELAHTIAGLARVTPTGQVSRLEAQAGAGEVTRQNSSCFREAQLVAPGAFN